MADGVLVVDVVPPQVRQGDQFVLPEAYYDDLVSAALAIPGVEHVALASEVPLTAPRRGYTEVAGDDVQVLASLATVSPDYFRVLGMTVTAGRPMADPGEIVVSEALAERLLPTGAAPVGRAVAMFASPASMRIVGTVAGTGVGGLDGREPEVFTYLTAGASPAPPQPLKLLLRCGPGCEVAASEVPQLQERGLLAVRRMATLNDVLASDNAMIRVRAGIVGIFAIASLAIVAAGILGLVAGQLALRRREAGVRLAIGGRPMTVAFALAGEALASGVAGVLAGILAALPLLRVLRATLVDFPAPVPAVVALAAVLSLASASLAAAVPAWRMATRDPKDLLRC